MVKLLYRRAGFCKMELGIGLIKKGENVGKETKGNMMTKINEIIDFLETDTLYVIFSSCGLKFLSLRKDSRAELVNLKDTRIWENPRIKLLVNETYNFLRSGKHQMPLDFTSFTDFEQQVFEIVSQIEPGEIITYKGIAEKLGKPGAAQAVGNALSKNPVAYFLPTFRVLSQRGLVICRSGAGHLREKFLVHEGHDLVKLRGNYVCQRKKCRGGFF